MARGSAASACLEPLMVNDGEAGVFVDLGRRVGERRGWKREAASL